MSFNHDLPRDQEHNMWDYLFLMMKIAGKSPRDYTVQELHFSTCLRQRGQEHRAFPINKALVLELGQDEEVRAWVRACTRVTGHYRRKTTSVHAVEECHRKILALVEHRLGAGPPL